MDRSHTYIEQPLLLASGREPISLGRYGLRRKLGAGASGTVWAAYDPESEEEVAVTLMRTLGGPDDRAPLLTQAVAWQRAQHPAVASIREVGLFSDPRDETGRRHGVYVVRELLPGMALWRWLDTLPADGSLAGRIVRAFCTAGRGLAAAHAQGAVHRDICSASIIMGLDGETHLIDFAGVGALPFSPGDGEEVDRFPAPELREGHAATAWSDQYSFCASLQAALLSRGARIGRRLREALARGMATNPDERWPSMDELIRALERSRSGWFAHVSAVFRNAA